MVILAINVLFTGFMIALFVWDYRTYGTQSHKDLKSIIMSSGVLGTFVGIFIGLLDFDAFALQTSIPTLLDGLKTAFYTSILGMGLAILLAILQKSKNIKSTEQNDIDFLFERLELLSHLRNLHHLTKLELLPTKDDIIELSRKNYTMIESCFSEVNTSLKLAVSELAKGASRELIIALESVIKDFNANLQTQFGENFKELNAAVGKLLSWQEEYRHFVQETQVLLRNVESTLSNTQSAMQTSQQTFEQILSQNERVSAFYEENLKIIQSCEIQNNKLQTHLAHIANLEPSSKQALQSLEALFDTMKENAKNAQSHIADLNESIKQYALQSAKDMQQNFDNATQSLIAQSAQKLESMSNDTMKTLQRDFILLRQSSDENLQEIRNVSIRSLDSMLEGLKQTLEESKGLQKHNVEVLHTLSEQASKNHNEILQTFSAQLKTMNEETLDALNASANNAREGVMSQYELSNKYIKTIALQYSKLLQKLSEDSITTPKQVSEQILSEFNEFQHAMIENIKQVRDYLVQNNSELHNFYKVLGEEILEDSKQNSALSQELKASLRNLDEAMSASVNNFWKNYEWFLQRITELIGARK